MSAFWKKRGVSLSGKSWETIKIYAIVVCVAFFMISATSCNRTSADKKAIARDTRIGCRLDNPVLEGFVVVNYVTDLERCPNPPGNQTVYTAMIIESYEDKPIGARMDICNGQEVPKGWVAVGPSQGAVACPREPGDSTVGPTRFIIQRVN